MTPGRMLVHAPARNIEKVARWDKRLPRPAPLVVGSTGRERGPALGQAILQPVAGSCKALAATPSTSFTLSLTCLR